MNPIITYYLFSHAKEKVEQAKYCQTSSMVGQIPIPDTAKQTAQFRQTTETDKPAQRSPNRHISECDAVTNTLTNCTQFLFLFPA